MTLGEVKDTFKRMLAFDAEKEQYDEARQTEQLNAIAERRRMAALAERLARMGGIPQGLQDAIEADHRGRLMREAELLRKAAPEFADPKRAEAERAAITEVLSAYDISPAEVAALDDHRFILAARDFAKLKRQMADARAQAKRLASGEKSLAPNSQAPGRTVPSGPKPNRATLAQRGRADQIARISRLLRG